jgi:hypothetical protein
MSFLTHLLGANTALYEPKFCDAAKHGDFELLEILVRSQRKVSQQCLDQSLVHTTTCASLQSVLLLVQAGANANYDDAAALMQAVDSEKVELATALIMAQKPPSGHCLDKALGSLFSRPSISSSTMDGAYLMVEVLLCGGPDGNAANQGLLRATSSANVPLMQLLLAHQVDINFDHACAVGYAIRKNRCDLMGILLQSQSLEPEIASELVQNIPRKISHMDKVAILSKLLVNGASGVHCSEQLILAAELDDLDTAQLLLTYGGKTDAPPVCSVNYNGARCLRTAISRNNIQLAKLLALEGDASKFSLSQAFSSIPPNLSGDDHFLMVQTLLRAGATGTEVDEALQSVVTAHHKSYRLIQLLVQFRANVTEQTLVAAASQGSTTILDILLTGNVTSSMCSSAITEAMKLPTNATRFNIVKLLLDHVNASGAEIKEISQAVIHILRNSPEDLDLLDLFCRHGKANVNSEDGLAVVLATKHSDLTPLKIVLQSTGSLPSSSTIEKALECAINLPLQDPNRPMKVKALLRKVKPQGAMNRALIQEIKSTLQQNQGSPVIPVLLDAGADVNTENGMPVHLAVSDPTIMDLILSKRPNAKSLSSAFPMSLKLSDPARITLCEKLLRAGAIGEEINTALCMVTKEGPAALPLMKLILPHADINYKHGRALRSVVQQVFADGLNLLLDSCGSIPSPATKLGAFKEAMKLKWKQDRFRMVQRLLMSGIGREFVSDALINAVNLEDVQMSEILLRNGGSVEHKGGQAVCSAASSGNAEILKLLVSSKPSLSTLTTGFGGAMSLKGDSYYRILQILLEAGMRGEAVDDALIQAVKEGDTNLKMTELLCRNGASIEWENGEAMAFAARSAALGTLDFLLGRQPPQVVLKGAYKAASTLSKEPRFQVIERLLKAGKQPDVFVSKTLTTAAMETPSDLRMIKMLLARGIFDEGQAIIHSARCLDLQALSLLVDSPKAPPYISPAFEAVEINDGLWQSPTGLAVVELLLKKGASGSAVTEALCQAIASLEASQAGVETLANNFVDIFLRFGTDVNYQRGLALQRATLQLNIPLIQKLLPSANPDSKAMAIAYAFTNCADNMLVLRALAAFSESFDKGEESLDVMFRHPDTNLEPILFLALRKFPRDTQILKALLEMGYPPNQWQFCANDSDVEPERWPILCWALEQPEKKISTPVIEMLIDEGGGYYKLATILSTC